MIVRNDRGFRSNDFRSNYESDPRSYSKPTYLTQTSTVSTASTALPSPLEKCAQFDDVFEMVDEDSAFNNKNCDVLNKSCDAIQLSHFDSVFNGRNPYSSSKSKSEDILNKNYDEVTTFDNGKVFNNDIYQECNNFIEKNKTLDVNKDTIDDVQHMSCMNGMCKSSSISANIHTISNGVLQNSTNNNSTSKLSSALTFTGKHTDILTPFHYHGNDSSESIPLIDDVTGSCALDTSINDDVTDNCGLSTSRTHDDTGKDVSTTRSDDVNSTCVDL